MGNAVAFFGPDGGISIAAHGFRRALSGVGFNLGNLLHSHALWTNITAPKFRVWPGQDVARIRREAGVIVLPASNQVNPAYDMGTWAEFIEACDLPVVCLGLGAQAGLDSSPVLDLKPGTRRLVSVLAEHCATIGVRGPFTQEVLAQLGVTNTEIVGCPSQLINPQVTGTTIADKLDLAGSEPDIRVAHALSSLEQDTRDTERNLGQMVRNTDHDLIVQSVQPLLALALSSPITAEDQAFVRWAGTVIRPDMPEATFTGHLRRHARAFSDARGWVDAMRRYDLVFGMQTSSVFAAIQAETAGVCVAFDSRTAELAETMGYPYIRSDKVDDGITLRGLCENAIFSASRFDDCKNRHIRIMRKALTDAGCIL